MVRAEERINIPRRLPPPSLTLSCLPSSPPEKKDYPHPPHLPSGDESASSMIDMYIAVPDTQSSSALYIYPVLTFMLPITRERRHTATIVMYSCHASGGMTLFVDYPVV